MPHRTPPHRLFIAAFVAAALVVFTSSAEAADKTRPNVVFFLVDDLGYMDIGAYNPNTFYETPNVDRLAQSGMRFTNGYAANPVCSPTRYSVMTGKYPTRAAATNWFSGNRDGRFKGASFNDFMPLEEVTLGEALRDGGYRTAFFGKWHLGPTEKYWPEAQGFDINFGGHSKGSPPGGYFAPYKNPKLKDGPEGELLTLRLADEAVRVIEETRDQPFLIYLSFHTVHTPLQAPQDLVEKYRRKAAAMNFDGPEFGNEEQVWPNAGERKVRISQRHAVYAAMVETMDTAVGRVLDKLREMKLDDNTIVCFMSDNGGLSTSEGSPTSNLPLRGGKGWVYEGGIREPFIIRAPGVSQPGSTCDTPVISTDFYPTLLDLAGLPARPDQTLDGVSLKPLLAGKSLSADRDLFWHYPHYANQGGFPGGAIRDGQWKLIERFEDGRFHLFNLADDVSEQHDLAAKHPDRVDAMRQRLHDWYKSVDARFLQAKNGMEPWSP